MKSLNFDNKVSLLYKSKSQKIRVLSENWFSQNMYCPCCGNIMLKKFKNNSPVADFYCEKCSEQFELKSTDRKIKNKIVDGAYETAINRVKSNSNPDLFVLQYKDFTVKNLMVIPKYFFTPDIIEKRKPLSSTARRAGWVGSNILYEEIPEQGKIKIIVDGEIISPEAVVEEYQKTKKLYVENIEKRGWLIDVLSCVNLINKNEFSLNEMYFYEQQLQKKHPGNNNVKQKIRQQLQFLRDKGFIAFMDNKGHYKKLGFNH